MCGGRYTLIYQRLDRFFAKLRDLGATLVFFYDGPVQDDKFSTWYERQKKKYAIGIKILDAVDRGINLDTMMGRFQWDFPGNTMFPVKEAAKKHGQIITAIANECDKELVQYANSVNALAIISNDTDFLIYKGFWQYWSSKEMNFETLTTKAYNRVALIKHLGLGFKHMPLLATLGGNDVIHYDEVKQFHGTLGRPGSKFHNLARFVEQLRVPVSGHDVKMLLARVFREYAVDDQLLQRFQNSLDLYDLDKRNPTPTSNHDQTLNKLLTLLNTFMYQIWIGHPVNVTSLITDLRAHQVGWQYPQLAVRLVKRQAGLVLYHRQMLTGSSRLRVVMKMSHEEDFALHEHQAEFPEHIRIPPLLDLLSKQPDICASLLETKLALYCWIASDTLDPNRLPPIPSILHPTVLTLYFLVENGVLQLFEADLLLQIAFEVAFERCDLDRVQHPRDRFNPRAFRISFLYPKVYAHMSKTITLVGLDGPDYRDCHQFDGVLFHNRYETWAQGKGVLDEIRQWRIYAHLVEENA
uniref:Putative ppargamma constitutive coactivator 1 n=1 Tax=Culex tarsalis TaxID=7177 RepID=A0A1Q3FBC9_CULTA